MHMFFVAFFRRRKKIIEQSELGKIDKTPNEIRFALVGGQENIGDTQVIGVVDSVKNGKSVLI